MKRAGIIAACAVMLAVFFSSPGISARKDRESEQLNEISELAGTGQTAEAIAGYQDFIKKNPKSELLGQANLSLGKLFLQKKDNDNALKCFNQVIVVSQDAAEKEEATLLTGRIFYGQNKFQETVDALRGVADSTHNLRFKAEMTSTLFYSYRQLGKPAAALFWLGQYTESTDGKELEKAKILAADLVPKLTDAELEQGLKAESPDWLKSEFSYQLAQRYIQANKPEQAKSALENLLKKYRDSTRRDEAGALLQQVEKSSRIDAGRIGLILPLSGPYQSFGERGLKGALLAAKIFQSPEGSPGVELRVVNADIDPQTASEAVRKMVMDDNIIGLVGPITNQNALVVADVCQQMGVPVVALSPVSGLAGKGNYVFRDCLTKQAQVNALLDWAMKVKRMDTFAVIYPQSKYGTEFAQLFEKEVAARGGALSRKVSYSESETDFRSEVRQLSGGRADAVFIPDSWDKVDQIVPQMLALRIKTQLLGTSGWHSPKLFEQIRQNYLEGAVFPDLFAPELNEKVFEDFQYIYQQGYNENPTLTDLQSFEAVSLIIDLVQKKNITTRKQLADALAGADNWEGPLGTVKVVNGEILHQPTLFRIEKGEFVPIK